MMFASIHEENLSVSTSTILCSNLLFRIPSSLNMQNCDACARRTSIYIHPRANVVARSGFGSAIVRVIDSFDETSYTQISPLYEA
jgi:hypothetical protein